MKVRSWKIRSCTSLAGIALGIGVAAVHGCGNTTSGGLVPSLPVEIGGADRDAGGPLFFTNQQGWQVELDQSVIAVGPFYFNTQPPGTQGLQVGTFIIQVTSQSFVNTLDPTLYPVDGGASGETGSAASADIYLFPPGCSGGGPSGNDVCGADQTPLTTYENLISQCSLFFLENGGLASGSSAYVAGTAQKPEDGGVTIVPFYGFITIDESTGGNPNDPAASPLASLQQVSGACPCPGGCGSSGGCSLDFTTQRSVLQIRVDPSHWFDGVDFSVLIPRAPTCKGTGAADAGCDAGPGWSPDAGPLTWNSVGTDSAFNTELVEQGLRAANGVYLFNVVPQESP
jgi:hypothetical protein